MIDIKVSDKEIIAQTDDYVLSYDAYHDELTLSKVVITKEEIEFTDLTKKEILKQLLFDFPHDKDKQRVIDGIIRQILL